MVSASIPSPDGAVENDHHHHHDHHTVEVDAAATLAPTPDTDPVGVIEAALVRLVDDVGVLAEEDVVRAFAILKATDLPSYLRLRHAAKKTNRDCSVPGSVGCRQPMNSKQNWERTMKLSWSAINPTLNLLHRTRGSPSNGVNVKRHHCR